MLPPDWQARMVDMIRGAAPLDGGWFAGGPALAPLEQIGVYREQFQLRLRDALLGELPGLSALMGEALDALFEPFLVDHPPDSWSLDHAARPFAGWLAARGAPQAQVDMARLEAAVMAGFSAADPAPLDLAALSPSTRLTLSPPVTVLALGWSVHRYRADALVGRDPAPLQPGLYHLAVYRLDHEVRHWELSPLQRALLQAFSPGATLEGAIEAALAQVPEPDGLGPAFHEIAARRILARAD